MGQKSSADLLRETRERNCERKLDIMTQIVKLEKDRDSQQKRAKLAMQKGDKTTSNALIASVCTINRTMTSMNQHIVRIDNMMQQMEQRQVGVMMMDTANDYVDIGKAFDRELSKEDIASIAEQHKETNKAFNDTNELIEAMFAESDPVAEETQQRELEAQLQDEIAIEAMRNIPDALCQVRQETATTTQVLVDKLPSVASVVLKTENTKQNLNHNQRST